MGHVSQDSYECDINTLLHEVILVCQKVGHPCRTIQICSPSKSSEDVLDIGVITSRFRDGDTQLSIAEGSHSCDDTRHDPDDDCKAHRASVLQHTLW